MKKIYLVTTCWLIFGVFNPVWPDADYTSENRINYVQQMLDAFGKSNQNMLKNIRNYIQAVDNNRCRSAYADLKTRCLLDAAETNCRQRSGRDNQRNCRLISDVMVANKLGEKEFLDTQTRYRIMKKNKKFRPAIRNELRRRYAELVTEFGLSRFYEPNPGGLAAGIDGYCRHITHKRGLSWQYCISAIVWFIGTNEIGFVGSD